MKGGTTGIRLTSKVRRVPVITSHMINVFNQFNFHQDLYTSYIQFIETSCIYLGTPLFQILDNFVIDFELCDQFQERYFAFQGGGIMICFCLGHQKVIRWPWWNSYHGEIHLINSSSWSNLLLCWNILFWLNSSAWWESCNWSSSPPIFLMKSLIWCN